MKFIEPQFIQTNGIRMAVYEQGSGIPVVLCHGFPELAFSWRHQIPALAQAGFHVITPDQRGYGRTDRPKPITDYDIMHLCDDLIGLLDALEIEKAIFCGHDWGGIIVWQMPLLHPKRVMGVIGVNTPFMPRASIDPIQMLRQVRGDNDYIVQFQNPEKAEQILEHDVEKTFRFFFRKRKMLSLEEFKKLPPDKRKLNLLEQLEAWDGQGEIICPENELDYYVRVFQQTGFTGGINWYRNMTRNWQVTQGIEQMVRAPSLMIGTTNDLALPLSLTKGMEQYIPDLEKHVIQECGHWTQQEKPEELNAIMLDWLKRRFS